MHNITQVPNMLLKHYISKVLDVGTARTCCSALTAPLPHVSITSCSDAPFLLAQAVDLQVLACGIDFA